MNSLICADDITLMSEGKEELKSLLMKVKESEKAGLKLKTNKQTNKKKKNQDHGIWSHHFMANRLGKM